MDRKINSRIGKTSAVFGQLKDRVYLIRKLKLSTEIKVSNALVVFTHSYIVPRPGLRT